MSRFFFLVNNLKGDEPAGLDGLTGLSDQIPLHTGQILQQRQTSIDKMAMDMAIDLREHDVAVVSLWPSFQASRNP